MVSNLNSQEDTVIYCDEQYSGNIFCKSTTHSKLSNNIFSEEKYFSYKTFLEEIYICPKLRNQKSLFSCLNLHKNVKTISLFLQNYTLKLFIPFHMAYSCSFS